MSGASGGQRLGILGGAFNPPHLGHLCLAQEAYARLGLDRVLLVPFRDPPHRELESDPGPERRLRLVERAVEGDDRLVASAVEIGRTGTSYTVDTLIALHEIDPGHDLTLILGADQALRLRSWREPERVLSLATVAVAERDGVGREAVSDALGDLQGAAGMVGFEMPRIDISSTLVRRRIAAGLPVRYLVPEAVAQEIEAEGLYTRTAPIGT